MWGRLAKEKCKREGEGGNGGKKEGKRESRERGKERKMMNQVTMRKRKMG